MAHKMDSVKSKQHNISFAIEEGLGDDTTFTFITPKDTIVKLQLTGPDGYHQIKQSNGSITTLLIPGTAKVGVAVYFFCVSLLQTKRINRMYAQNWLFIYDIFDEKVFIVSRTLS